MKKKGFTLTELLLVIALIAILTIIAVPNVLKMYNQSVDEFFSQQQGNVLEAANIYVQDYCKNKISTEYACPGSYVFENNNERYLCLKDIQATDYIDDVSYKGNDCEGMIIFDKNGKNGKVYLYCGIQSDGTYTYKTSDTVNIKSNCKVSGAASSGTGSGGSGSEGSGGTGTSSGDTTTVHASINDSCCSYSSSLGWTYNSTSNNYETQKTIGSPIGNLPTLIVNSSCQTAGLVGTSYGCSWYVGETKITSSTIVTENMVITAKFGVISSGNNAEM